MKLRHSLLADGAPGRRGFRVLEADGSKTTSAGALTGVGFGLPFTILSSSSCSPYSLLQSVVELAESHA